ncbi:MAG: hypothetical protein J0H83_12435 [Candidatus Melainabacteria bacterium]|nr:hypothetical protein [Candidatus Melainabacteria bacterium]
MAIYGRLTLAFSLAHLVSWSFVLPVRAADSDWIEGDADEVRLHNNRFPTAGAGSQRPTPLRSRPEPQAEQPELFQPRSERYVRDTRYNGADDEDVALQADNPPPQKGGERERPVLKVGSGNTKPLQGGVSSIGTPPSRLDRGRDSMAAQLLQQAPYLDRPSTIAVSPSAFKAFLEKNHKGEAAAFGKTTIIEIKGKWDDSGHIIRSFGLPSTKVPSSKLPETDLSQTRILVANCGAEFNEASIKTIRDFVAQGGFLLSTDWALDACLKKAFPGYVEWDGGYTENRVVDAVIVDRDPVLLAGVPRVAHWKLEDKSQTVRVLKRREVQVLARSRALIQMQMGPNATFVTQYSHPVLNGDPVCEGTLALTFSYGQGHVLHLIGHFDNNADRAFTNALADPAPIIGIGLRQAIACNFIMAAMPPASE